MDVVKAENRDYSAVANLHINEISRGFLSTLGNVFLLRLYETINKEDGACVLVARENKDILGFIAGVIDTKGLFKKIVMKKWMYLLPPLVWYIFRFAVLKKMVETVMYGFKKKDSSESIGTCTAELLAIAVGKDFQGKGIGRMLLSELEVFFTSKDISKYKVVTFSLDNQSNKFYTSCDFKQVKSFLHHGNVMNEYIKVIV